MTTKITEQNISQLANAGVNWQPVVTADGSTGLTAVAGRGYFIDTTSGAQTVTLPASPKVGDVVVLKDYARTWGTNNVTIASTTFDGVTNNPSFSTTGQTVTLVYMDNTKGWSLINEDTTTGLGAEFISATGGTVTTSGDFKIHTFTGDGCFVVSTAGNPAGSDTVNYLVVAGGGGGGNGPGPSDRGAGGGAGGFRESHSTPVSGCYTASPLATPTGIVVSTTTYPITVGSGGSGAAPGNNKGINGNNSIFSTITSAGGGGGGAGGAPRVGNPGGSGGGGGGGGNGCAGGTGNTPPTSPPQGNNGGFGGGAPISTPNIESAGGGGAGAAGTNATPSAGGFGGDGVGTLINPATGVPGPGCLQYYAGGGGAPGNGGDEALGGGGISCTVNAAGDANSGGGGAGAFVGSPVASAAGGSGIVIIRYKFQ